MPYERITEAVDVPADEGDEAIPFE
jgi:hypothetical protein